jgi:hypothetical protein
LRIAARNNNLCIRVPAMRAANECPRRAIRFCSHAARIHHHYIGRRWRALAKPSCAQMPTHRFAISARSPAPEMFNMKLRHKSSLLPTCTPCRRTASKATIRYTVD